jgi:hypothetical protein
MQAASVETIKAELRQLPPKEVLDLLLRLARFKKENKELLTYLLFESADEAGYIEQIKAEIKEELEKIDGLPAYQYKKQFRKIQRKINKPIKYTSSKTAAVELYMHMVNIINEKKKTIFIRAFLEKNLVQYISKIEKLLPGISDDLAHDIRRQLEQIKN